MARKTNKTDHVLGLLSGKNEEMNATENQREEDLNGAKSDVAGSNVQVVAKQEEDDAIANTVNQLLEEELEDDGKSAGFAAREPEFIFDEGDEEEALRAAEEEAREIFEEEERRAAEEKARKAAEEEEKKAAEEEARKAEEARLAEEEAIRKAEEEALKKEEERKAKAEEEKEYVFLNVMENLVREKVDGYMDQFGTCHCSRCKADIIALALTGLPSKYVVVSRNAATPLMNFYAQRYAGMITVEITKACTKVKEHPHHSRE